jgi:hypothetical protein
VIVKKSNLVLLAVIVIGYFLIKEKNPEVIYHALIMDIIIMQIWIAELLQKIINKPVSQ